MPRKDPRDWTPAKFPYRWKDYPLPPVQAESELRTMCLMALALHELSAHARAYMHIVLTRIPESMTGVFEFKNMMEALHEPNERYFLVKRAQGELYRKGLVRWQRVEGAPGPLSVQVAVLLGGDHAGR